MPPKLPPHVFRVKNRVGRPYLYFQRHRGTARSERLHRLPDDPTSRDFWTEYARLSGLPPEQPKPNSVVELVQAWHASPEWRALARSTASDWLRYSERIVAAGARLRSPA
jgi:hypothetical protein